MTLPRALTPPLVLLTGLVLVSRLPFLAAGFGDDADAWRIANTASHLATTGDYRLSRGPGYPLPEFVYGAVWWAGGRAFAFNALTALFSVGVFVAFLAHLQQLRCRDHWLAGLALAFTTVVYVHSTDAMDYIWALAFILGAYWAAFAGRLTVAGVMLGLAAACRLTSIGMIIPLALLVVSLQGRIDVRSLLRLTIAAALVTIVAFTPAFLVHGLGFLHFVDFKPPLDRVLYRASFEVWSVIGVIAVLAAVPAAVYCRLRGLTPAIPVARPVLVAWVVGIVIYVLLYLRLPHEGGYLIPVVPLTILLLGGLLDRHRFAAFCCLLIISPFLLSVDRAGFHLAGAIFRDHEMRRDAHELVARLIAESEARAEEKRVVVVGWYEPQVSASLDRTRQHFTRFVSLLSAADIDAWRQRGYSIYYLREVVGYNRTVHRVDLPSVGAMAIDLDP